MSVLRVVIEGFGVTDAMKPPLQAAVVAALAGRDDLSVVLTRMRNGEWTVFIADSANLEVMDPGLAGRLARAVKDAERGL